jgi:hypothetical protein
MSGTNAAKAGRSVLVYHNTGTYGTPTWNLVDGRRDWNLNAAADVADASDADGGVNEEIVVSRGYELAGQIRWADSADDWEIFRAAFDADPHVPLEFAAMYGPIATSATTGRRLTCNVKQFNESFPYKDILVADMVCTPAPNANAKPAIYTVP